MEWKYTLDMMRSRQPNAEQATRQPQHVSTSATPTRPTPCSNRYSEPHATAHVMYMPLCTNTRDGTCTGSAISVLCWGACARQRGVLPCCLQKVAP